MPKTLLDLPIAELKRQLVNGTNFAAIMHFFFDHFADESAFMDASYPVQVPKTLAQAVGRVFANLDGVKIRASTWRIGDVSLLNLIHGTIETSHGTAVILWASDISTGLLGMPNTKTGQSTFARITVDSPKSARAN